MSRPSPQTDRVIAIVNVLTERSARGATLSEVAAAIGQAPTTLVHVLGSLTAGGFLVRRPSDRRYHLGPALIEPPIGSAFFAWGGADLVERWISPGSTAPEARAVIVERLAASRTQGYVVTLRPPPQLEDELRRFVDRGQHLRRAEHLRTSMRGIDQYLAGRVDRRRSYDVSALSIPVICPGAPVELALNLVGFDGPISGRRLHELGRSSRSAADRLGEQLSHRTNR